METMEKSQTVRGALMEGFKAKPAAKLSVRQRLNAGFIACLAADKSLCPSEALVRDMARTALEALLTEQFSLGQGSVEVMQAMVDIAGRWNLDAEYLMRSALPGLAEVGRRAPEGAILNMQKALDGSFMGLGHSFTASCRQTAAGLS